MQRTIQQWQVIAVVLVLVIVVAYSVRGYVADVFAARAQEHISGATYDAQKARVWLEWAVVVNPNDQENSFALAHLYSVDADYETTRAFIDQYKERFPDEKRIHYIAGLTEGFAGNFEQAGIEFETFLTSGLSNWGGYLDLAWVRFQQGKFEESRDVLVEAVAKEGSNVWLDTALGATYVALGDTEKALSHLDQAEAAAGTLTVDEWRGAYSFNNPAKFEQEIDELRKVIRVNKVLAQGGDSTAGLAEALNSKFVGVSPLGYTKGITVSACIGGCTPRYTACQSAANACGVRGNGMRNSCTGVCSATVPSVPPGYGTSCTRTNACGSSRTGTIQCNGQCSVTAPANPAGYGVSCTRTNACGASNTGTIQCNGQCSVSAPSVPSGYGSACVATNLCGQSTAGTIQCNGQCGPLPPLPPGHGSACTLSTESCGILSGTRDCNGQCVITNFSQQCTEGEYDPSVNLTVSPTLVSRGNTVSVGWTSVDVSNCTVTGTNGDSWTGTTGGRTSSGIQEQTTFTLSCTTYTGGTLTDSVTVRVNPIRSEE